VPPTAESLAVGQQVYQQQCSACHGATGRGDGPLAASLRPRPVDLQVHAPQHPDSFLFEVISKGVPGTAMPPFAAGLSEDERWHVLNYIRALAAEGATPTPAPPAQ
jgi:high-affinity iron transporter